MDEHGETNGATGGAGQRFVVELTDPQRVVASRRHSALVGAVCAFVVPIWLIATLVVVGSYRDNHVPKPGDAADSFVRFYVDNFSTIRITSTMFIVGWVLVLVVLASLVHALEPRRTLLGTFAVTMAGLWLAVLVVAQGLFTWPTLIPEVQATDLPVNLDPGVARFLVLSIDGVQGAGGVLLGVALLLVALIAVRSDLWGHTVIAVVAALLGVAGVLNMVLGGGGTGVEGMILFGLLGGPILLVARHRLGAATPET